MALPRRRADQFGVVHSVLLAQSTNRDRNLKASSGGLVKELLLHYLDQPDVDGVLALGHVDGIDFETRLVTEPEGVDLLPGSIYHNLAQPKALELLHSSRAATCSWPSPASSRASTATSARSPPSSPTRSTPPIGLLCGWQYSHHSPPGHRRLQEDRPRPGHRHLLPGRGTGRSPPHVDRRSGAAVGRRVDFNYQVAFDRSFNTPAATPA